MKNEFVTIKIWKKTLSKLRLIAAVEEKSMSSVLESMVMERTPEGFGAEPVESPVRPANIAAGTLKQEASE